MSEKEDSSNIEKANEAGQSLALREAISDASSGLPYPIENKLATMLWLALVNHTRLDRLEVLKSVCELSEMIAKDIKNFEDLLDEVRNATE